MLGLLVVMLPSCRKRGPAGPAGPGATVDSRKPDAPGNLRLETHPAGAPDYLLRWDQPAGGAQASMHVVYAASFASNTIDPLDAVAAVGPGLDTAAVTLLGDTGLRHLRVTAISPSGIESLPSPAFVVDTTGHLLFRANVITDGVTPNDLCSVVPASPAQPAHLNARIGNETVTSFRASPDGRRAAFLSDRDTAGSQQLFVVAIDGSSAPVRISGPMSAPGQVRGYSWALTGDRLAFTADVSTDGVIEAFVAPADGSTARVKVSGTMVAGGGIDADATDVKWSPNGVNVAYLARQRDSQVQELFVARAAGSAPPVAVSGDLLVGSFVASFDWSPDGRQLSFVARRDNSVLELFVAPANGAALPAVRSGAVIQGSNVAKAQWSPDSRRLAFLAQRNGGYQVFVTPADEAEEPVPLDGAFPQGGVTDSFAWSPDATHIAFVADDDGESPNELFLAPATGGVPATAVSDGGGTVLDFAWSPDGEQLAFRLDNFQRIALFTTVPGFGGAPFLVSGSLGFVIEVETYDWSSEGDRMAFRAFTTNEQSEVFVVDRYGQLGPSPLPGTSSSGAPQLAFPHLGQR